MIVHPPDSPNEAGQIVCYILFMAIAKSVKKIMAGIIQNVKGCC